ncbi:hypothetical protein [Algibacter sp. 2305UL17-15]|uniref:hypothetical protein n=1 Tax=Algibacter sp. 2305UL17-15 TaxID=3231268 RepID=UPI00345962BE
MKTYILLLMVGLFSLSCNSQKKEETVAEQPEGTWKVEKEFDENGNLIRYDSIYSWSSDGKWDGISSLDKDSLLQSFESKFYRNFSHFKNEGFDDVFTKDSLFSNHFFNDDFFKSDFGKDFIDIDKIRQRMIERQKQFLEKYRSEFIKPEDE